MRRPGHFPQIKIFRAIEMAILVTRGEKDETEKMRTVGLELRDDLVFSVFRFLVSLNSNFVSLFQLPSIVS